MKEQPTPIREYTTTLNGQEVTVKVYPVDDTPPKKVVTTKKPSLSKVQQRQQEQQKQE